MAIPIAVNQFRVLHLLLRLGNFISSNKAFLKLFAIFGGKLFCFYFVFMKILIFFLLSFTVVSAQNDSVSQDRSDNYTADIHFGGWIGSSGAFILGANWSYSNFLLQGRFLSYTNHPLTEKAILVGFKSEAGRNSFSFSLSAGVGQITGSYFDYPTYSYINDIGMALQFASIYPVNEFFGTGFSIHANINKTKPVTAFAFSLHLGKLY